ncbi:hypothetical protein KSS87_011389 [Heliosperma pusillum]|nr:hypothetical protein KSS87_011340 [Heliosperma pusillum]KAH9622673.1 hypothetical protein KSS87_011389 [Heliosperma pusillum]
MRRPRKSARVEVNEVQQTATEGHHEAIAQPTIFGREGRVIRTGRGGGRGDVRGGRADRGCGQYYWSKEKYGGRVYSTISESIEEEIREVLGMSLD